MTREEDDDDDDEEDGFYFDGFHRDHPDPGGAWRFGFSVGPEGMRLQEPQAFGQMFREMEEIFSQFGHIGMTRPQNIYIKFYIYCMYIYRNLFSRSRGAATISGQRRDW